MERQNVKFKTDLTGEVNGHTFDLQANTQTRELPAAVAAYLVQEDYASTRVDTVFQEHGAEQIVELPPEVLEQIEECNGDIRIQCEAMIEWVLFDAHDRWEGELRLDPGKVVWLRKDIAEVAIKAGAARRLNWPEEPSRNVTNRGKLNCGYFYIDSVGKPGPQTEIQTGFRNQNPGQLIPTKASEGHLAHPANQRQPLG